MKLKTRKKDPIVIRRVMRDQPHYDPSLLLTVEGQTVHYYYQFVGYKTSHTTPVVKYLLILFLFDMSVLNYRRTSCDTDDENSE